VRLPRRLLCCLLGLLGCGVAAAPALAAGDQQVLVLGSVSDDPRADYVQLKALLDYVVPRMADVGIREGRVLMARDVQQMASYLRRGRVDWVAGTAGTAVQLEQRAGAQPLVVSDRGGASSCRGLIFVRADSGITALDDLHGRSIAFERALSTDGYLVPAMQLLQHGMQLQALSSPKDRPDDDSVGYIFARDRPNVAAWVRRGLVDAGVTSVVNWNNPDRFPQALRRELRIVQRSPEYPCALESTRSGLDPQVQARLREVLIGAAADPDAREALLQYARTRRFLPVDAAAAASLRELRDGVARVRAEVE
jgi:phosphonate transport system substrate-binding protein